MKFTNTYRYVVLKQVMFLILFLIILVCMIKIDLEYLKQEVRIVFAFVIYFV
jgi:cell division protein FtsW (lipid II flippase)